MIKNIKNTEEIIINSDKTGNKYMVNKDEYKRIIVNEITKDHSKLNETCDKVENTNSKAFIDILKANRYRVTYSRTPQGMDGTLTLIFAKLETT